MEITEQVWAVEKDYLGIVWKEGNFLKATAAMMLFCMDISKSHSASPWLSVQPFRKDSCLPVLGHMFKLILMYVFVIQKQTKNKQKNANQNQINKNPHSFLTRSKDGK